eukprot:TRINITY_DN1239_c0_g1_i1.p3 TRINITY_DN1239_c0_g1~~TRINITY_DN1239_c0_g1_i1.p3  ORF type:complete len:112 (+),score=6.94 TRINITY_DN1239_c0_g1_i1:161-496(+)
MENSQPQLKYNTSFKYSTQSKEDIQSQFDRIDKFLDDLNLEVVDPKDKKDEFFNSCKIKIQRHISRNINLNEEETIPQESKIMKHISLKCTQFKFSSAPSKLYLKRKTIQF